MGKQEKEVIRYGRWLVVGKADANKWGQTMVCCECSCGIVRDVSLSRLRSGGSLSCGCYNRDILLEKRTKHGMSISAEFNSWVNARQRCGNSKNPAYNNYGGRGVTICKRWEESFENFYADMGPKPTPQHSLDRVDSDGDYCPENCKWSTEHEQQCNRRNNLENVGVHQTKSGNWCWKTEINGKRYQGTCKTQQEAAIMYDNKNEDLGRGRPNNTERSL